MRNMIRSAGALGLLIFCINLQAELTLAQRFYAIKMVLPGIKKVGIICDVSKNQKVLAQIGALAAQYQLEVALGPASSMQEVSRAFTALTAQKVNLIWVFPDEVLKNNVVRRYILEKAILAKIPIYGCDVNYVKEGALFWVEDKGGEALVHLNMRTAAVLGLTIPDEVKAKAVIEKE